MMTEVKEALLTIKEEQDKIKVKQPVVDGYTNFVFLNVNGNPMSRHNVEDAINGIVKCYNKDEKRNKF